MTSVVDTSVKHFHNGMVGAPVLNGTAGSMIAVLNACLVTGFDTKSVASLVVAGGVATLSFTGTHSAAVDSVVLVEGVTGALTALNGEQKVTAIGAGVVKFATAAADGTAAGTITFKMAPAGWTQPFTGTNLATYKSADPASTGMILRVDDTDTMVCRVVGYEQMTAVSAGTGMFPTTAQMSGGGYWAKSTVASATAIPYVIVADARKMILHIAPGVGNSATYTGGTTKGFGDDRVYRPGGDPYACSLSYSTAANPAGQVDGGIDYNTDPRHAMPRGYSGLGSAVIYGCYSYFGGTSTSGVDDALGAFPSVVDGGLRLTSRYFAGPGGAGLSKNPRSEVPGLMHVPMSDAYEAFKTRDIVQGSGALAGRRFMVLNPSAAITSAPQKSYTGVSLVDITGPWAR